MTDNLIPQAYKPSQLLGINIPGSGILLIIIVIFLTGVLVTNFIGKRLFEVWERLLNKIPGFRNIYNAIKQISDTVLTSSSDSFKKVLLIEYPRKGLWTVAFQTGNYHGEAEKIIGQKIINVYVPTTPNPTSGFFIMLPKEDVSELNMSVDDALKLIISGGIVTPKESQEISTKPRKKKIIKKITKILKKKNLK